MKLSQLTPAGPLAGTEDLPLVQGGASKRATVDDVLKRGMEKVRAAGFRFDVSFTALLPDGVAIRGAYTGANNRAVAGIDASLRWFASGGFYAPMGGKLTLGTSTVHGRRTDYAWGVTGTNDKPLLALDWQGRTWLHDFRALKAGTIDGNLGVGGNATVAGSLTVGGTFTPAAISASYRYFNATAGQSFEKSVEANWHWAIYGSAGKPVLGVYTLDGDVHLKHTGSSARLSMLFADAANLARGRTVQTTPHNVTVASLNAASHHLVIGYGQSLMSSMEAWPRIPRTAEPDTLMMGDSIRPQTANTNAWAPIGAAAFNPLASTVEANVNSGRANLSDAAVAALAAGDLAEGESPLTEAVRHLSRGWRAQPGAGSKKLVAANTAVAGKTIEALSKGAAYELYLRNTQAKAVFDGLVAAAGGGATGQALAVLLMQGEWNYDAAQGGTQDYAIYKAALATLRTNLLADLGGTPALLTYVTGGVPFTKDSTNLSISNAQVDFALETPGVWCFGPVYPVTDKGGHLNANGSRWVGAMAGKVLRRVLVERLGFEPLTPVKIEKVARTIYVHFAPASPLQWQAAYDQNAATLRTDRGFRVTDDAGSPGIAGIEIVGGSIVAITLDRAIGANPYVWYASQGTGSLGNLCDSDPTRADDVFEYLAGTGMYGAENVGALAGKPYPLFNWCVPFRRAVGYSR